ncbi:MAG: efflux RND transporter periplasmic adaptor subunit [Phycisphaerae bacterium]|nr:efflux RND transporter periplasmic adaptor subunit [Phycisphaerae bacterium]
MKKPWIQCLVFFGLLAATGVPLFYYGSGRSAIGQAQPHPPETIWPGHDPHLLFSAPGVTEPSSRTLQIFSEASGTIRQIFVKSGDAVTTGQALFELINDTQMAQVRHRQALVRAAQAQLAKLRSWERPEDRIIAREQWQEAEAMVHLAEYELKRVESLVRENATSDKELINVRENNAAARARANAAKARFDRAEAGPSKEDVEVCEAAVDEAQTQLQVSQTVLAKTTVRSPIDGIVIYRHLEPGEAVGPEVGKPVLSIGNRDVLHLRADVDETDLAKVKLGQQIFATADAFGSTRFGGRVVHIEQTLGRKNFRTYSPTERTDTRILEVVIALDDGGSLPLDLQMTTWFLDDDAPDTASK